MVVVFSLFITVIIFLFGDQLLSLFLDPGDTSGALGYGLSYMHTVSLFYILMGLLFVSNGMLRGSGDMAAFTLSSMANLFSRVGIAYALAYLTPLAWAPSGGPSPQAGPWRSVSLLRVRSGKWARKAIGINPLPDDLRPIPIKKRAGRKCLPFLFILQSALRLPGAAFLFPGQAGDTR